MNFELTREQTELQSRIHDFAKRELGADFAARDTRGVVDDQDWRRDWDKCADFGIFGLPVPEKFGGTAQGIVNTVIALEAIGYGCVDNGLGLGMGGQIWAVQEPLMTFGNDAQKQKYLPGLANGTLVGSLGLTEQDAGSNIMNLKTTAKACDGGYVLNGSKAFVGMAPACDFVIIFAVTEPDHGKWGISGFLVELGDKGFTRGRPEKKMGMRTIPMGDLHFNDCWIPADRMLAGAGAGMSIFQHIMEWERSFIFCGHVGAMARQLEQCTKYARERKTFGKPIIEHQSVSNRLADMKLRLESSRLHLYRVAHLKEAGRACLQEASMTKLQISEAFVANSMDAIRIHGGNGYMTEMGIEHDLRDAFGGVIYSGTSDIQRQIITQLLE